MVATQIEKVALLKDRAQMLAQVRTFFSERQVLEVDLPQLSQHASIDEHIELIPAQVGGGKIRYLHSSPEYGMKRLLSLGLGDIYQLSHVFRQGEVGSRHQPEFTLIEWYRVGFSYEQMVAETVELIRCFVGEAPLHLVSYRDLLIEGCGIDYMRASDKELLAALENHQVEGYRGIEEEGRDPLLNLLMSCVVEPSLCKERITVVKDYPATQCALARLEESDGGVVAKRFEIFYGGFELANGYDELTDSVEQRERFNRVLERRASQGKVALPIDSHFLQALERGLPPCCGVAVGFDRLLMIRHSANSLADILPIGWEEA